MKIDNVTKTANDRLSDRKFFHQVYLKELALSDFTITINDAKDEGKIEVARNMFNDGMDAEIISKYTKLSVDKINEVLNS